MKENPSKHEKDITTTAEFILAPELLTHCPKCGGEIALWSKDTETVCIFCNHKVFAKEKTEH